MGTERQWQEKILPKDRTSVFHLVLSHMEKEVACDKRHTQIPDWWYKAWLADQ